MPIKLGTAGWTIPRADAHSFSADGSSLQRYSSRLSVTEINSSFHRAHRASTWQRWSDSVPQDFRFSVKLPKSITHEAKLAHCSTLLGNFLVETEALGDKLAVLLVQLPPKLELNRSHASDFFKELRERTSAMVACEPRNASWFTVAADELLVAHEVARVAADPAICDQAAHPGGWRGLNYWRFHGSPVVYRSSYANRIDTIRDRLVNSAPEPSETWCIFDNTASSQAMSDVLALAEQLRKNARP